MKMLIKYTRILTVFLCSILFTGGLSLSFTGCVDDNVEPPPSVVAGFTHTLEDDKGTVRFLNTSENADTYSWNFGDGTSSTEESPVKQFASGTYTVVLTARSGSLSGTFSDEITILVREGMTLPANFDNSNVDYIATTFNGATFAIVDNPAPGGSNDVASKVGAVTNSGAAFEGLFFDLASPVNFATDDKTITMNFWSDAPIAVLLKLEEGTEGPIEVATNHKGTGWEAICFDYSSTAQYSRLTLFVDGPGTTAGTFYFDNIRQSELIDKRGPVITLKGDATMNVNTGSTFTDPGATALDNVDGDVSANIVVGGDAVDTNTEGSYVITYNVMDAAGNAADEVTRTVIVATASITSLPIDFENGASLTGAFDGGANGLNANNPDKSGINTSDKVYQFNKTVGSAWYSGAFHIFDENINATGGKAFKLKMWSPKANINVRFQLEKEGSNGTVVTYQIDKALAQANTWVELVFDFSGTPLDLANGYDKIVIFPDYNEGNQVNVATEAIYYIDDITQATSTGGGGGGGGGGGSTFDSGLLTNGDFEAGAAPWTIGVGSDPVPVTTTDGNTYYSVNVAAAGNPFDVNMSQRVAITADATYTLTFDAWSDRSRNIVAGIGLSGDPWSNTVETVGITTTRTTYTYTLTATGFGAPDARVIFDIGAEIGLVNIDNVSLFADNSGGGGGGGTFDDGLLTNGDFEAGAAPWTIGVGSDPVPVTTTDGNTYYSVNVAAAGNPFDVNMSQRVAITADATYTLSFDAWSDRSRNIVAGIGLSGDPWSNTVETVAITTTRTTYTYTLTANGFGAPDARVIFDIGAEIGLVNIDNVSLFADNSGGGGGGGGGGSGTVLSTNGDFEAGDTGWLLFQNGGSASIDNSLNNGGTTSGRLATNGPSNPAFKQERIGAGSVQAGNTIKITFDHIGSVTQPGAVFNVLLFGEASGDGGASFTHVFNPAPSLSNNWTTFTGTFTIPNGTNVGGGISFLIEAVCGGDAGCSVTANIDNVSVIIE